MDDLNRAENARYIFSERNNIKINRKVWILGQRITKFLALYLLLLSRRSLEYGQFQDTDNSFFKVQNLDFKCKKAFRILAFWARRTNWLN